MAREITICHGGADAFVRPERSECDRVQHYKAAAQIVRKRRGPFEDVIVAMLGCSPVKHFRELYVLRVSGTQLGLLLVAVSPETLDHSRCVTEEVTYENPGVLAADRRDTGSESLPKSRSRETQNCA